jgi:hypothetical protein
VSNACLVRVLWGRVKEDTAVVRPGDEGPHISSVVLYVRLVPESEAGHCTSKEQSIRQGTSVFKSAAGLRGAAGVGHAAGTQQSNR